MASERPPIENQIGVLVRACGLVIRDSQRLIASRETDIVLCLRDWHTITVSDKVIEDGPTAAMHAAISAGGATLRAKVLGDAIDKNLPINWAWGTKQEAYERLERLSIRLMEEAERIRREMR